jgi:hypothetical protein
MEPAPRSRTRRLRGARGRGRTVRRFLSERRSRGVTGQGLLWIGGSRLRSPAPLAALARAESFAPTRSARTPRVVGPWSGRPEWPVRHVRTHLATPRFRGASPRRRAFASPSAGPPPAPSREGGCVPLHPRCLPLSKLPSGEGPSYPQAVPSLWIPGLAPLQSPRVPFHRRKMRREREDSTTFRRASPRARRRRPENPV